MYLMIWLLAGCILSFALGSFSTIQALLLARQLDRAGDPAEEAGDDADEARARLLAEWLEGEDEA